MSEEKNITKAPQELLQKAKDSFKPDQIVAGIKEDRYSMFCGGLVGLSVLLGVFTWMASSTAHPEKVLNKYISAGEDGDLVALSELAPGNSYRSVAEQLGMEYRNDVLGVLRDAQRAGAKEIRAAHVAFVNKRQKFNQALRDSGELRQVPYAEQEAFVQSKWQQAGGSGTSYVTNVTVGRYGVRGFTSAWTEISNYWRTEQGYLNWSVRQKLDKDLEGSSLLDANFAETMIEDILNPEGYADVLGKMASLGWTKAAAEPDNQLVVGNLSYAQVASSSFASAQGDRLLPISIQTFYDEEVGAEEKESDIEPAGEGLFQPGVATAQAKVPGGYLQLLLSLDDGAWKIRQVSDINNVSALYNTMKSRNLIAPTASATTPQEG